MILKNKLFQHYIEFTQNLNIYKIVYNLTECMHFIYNRKRFIANSQLL